MATLHLMVGLPGSGKTTEAKKLEAQTNALRLSPDEWQYFLFGHDVADPAHDDRHSRVEALMWTVAEKVLLVGTDVILDFGFWSRAERDAFRQKAAALGADCRLHFMDVPLAVIWERLDARNRTAGENAAFFVKKEELEEWAGMFEAPTEDEWPG